MRLALGIEYNGSGYCGWQSQPSGCGIQDRLETAIASFLGAPDERVPVVCAGRTDTGVHALMQVVHLDTGIMRDEISWVRGVNASLPADIRVIWSRRVSDEFHARFSAESRTYRYLLLNDAVEPAVMRGTIGWFHTPLDIAAIQQAADVIVGEHDFSAFRAAECQAKSPVRTLSRVQIEQCGNIVAFDFSANAFLHHMIRNIVGALVYVGAGRHSLNQFQEIFESRNRSLAAPTFMADGLYLANIQYDAKFGIPATTAATRRFPF